MTTVKIDTNNITDWKSFHKEFKDAFGFPDFYGDNMDAWIDCVSSLDCDDGMTKVHVEVGKILVIDLGDVSNFIATCPDQYSALIECAAFVNHRRIDVGEKAIVALSFYKNNAG